MPVAYCADCGLWFVSRTPSASALENLYRGYWLRTRPIDMGPVAAEQVRRRAPAEARADVRLQRLKAVSGGLRGMRLLDVGCGLGEFLVAAGEEGVRTLGSDISPEACEFARGLGLEIHEGTLAECEASIAPVDTVVMSDLIEHPVEPLALLEASRRILKPGGRLLLWTPNGGAAGETAATARDWVGFRVDLEHLQYFSTRTVNWLSRHQGWEIEHLETLGHPDLRGVQRLSSPAGDGGGRWRALLKKLPGAVFVVRRARATIERVLLRPPGGAERFARDGSYHLFAILRRSRPALGDVPFRDGESG